MICLLAFFFIRNLGTFISWFDVEVGSIFLVLKTAQVRVAFWVPAAFIVLFGCVFALVRNRKGKKAWLIASGIIFFILAFLVTVLLSKVNGVRIFDVVSSLLELVKNGVLNEL